MCWPFTESEASSTVAAEAATPMGNTTSNSASLIRRTQTPSANGLVRRIGMLTNLVADDPEAQARVGAFLQGLQEFGWTLGRNVRIANRWGGGDADRTRRYAAKLVARAPVVSLAAAARSWRRCCR